jgi:hypothetical protein
MVCCHPLDHQMKMFLQSFHCEIKHKAGAPSSIVKLVLNIGFDIVVCENDRTSPGLALSIKPVILIVIVVQCLQRLDIVYQITIQTTGFAHELKSENMVGKTSRIERIFLVDPDYVGQLVATLDNKFT